MTKEAQQSQPIEEKTKKIVVIHLGVHQLRLPENDLSEDEMILEFQKQITLDLIDLEIVVLDSWFSGIKASRRYWILVDKFDRAYGRFAGWMVRVLERLKKEL